MRPSVAVSLLGAVAVLGYVIGHGPGSGSSRASTRTVLLGGVLIDYPAGWTQTAAPPTIPGLSISHGRALGPPGAGSRMGLIVGSLPPGQTGPLPQPLVASLRSLPHTDVVSLVELQAYRYSRVSLAGFTHSLTLFAIPSASALTTILACYAPRTGSPFMVACGQVAAAITSVGQPLGYDLTPVPAYARALAGPLSALERARAAAAQQAAAPSAPAEYGALAASLSRQFAHAAASLTALEAPAAARSAQATLVAGVLSARDAYSALSGAVRAQDASAYRSARSRSQEGEAAVDAALRTFALIGYGAAGRSGKAGR